MLKDTKEAKAGPVSVNASASVLNLTSFILMRASFRKPPSKPGRSEEERTRVETSLGAANVSCKTLASIQHVADTRGEQVHLRTQTDLVKTLKSDVVS